MRGVKAKIMMLQIHQQSINVAQLSVKCIKRALEPITTIGTNSIVNSRKRVNAKLSRIEKKQKVLNVKRI